MEIDLLSPSSYQGGHPHAQYRWLRDHAPVYRHSEPNGPGFWVVTRYADVKHVGRDHLAFSSEPSVLITDEWNEAASEVGGAEDRSTRTADH